MVLLVGGMFAFGYALVPLYGLLCDAVGFNGRSNAMILPADAAAKPVSDRLVTVEFVTTVNGGKDWKFAPESGQVQVHPGQLYTVNFHAENPKSTPMVAQAVPSITPWRAAKYVRKTECFCFREQAFAAHEGREMPVRFMVDPELPADVDTVTVSYTFFELTQLSQTEPSR